jgi:hypothetical protein
MFSKYPENDFSISEIHRGINNIVINNVIQTGTSNPRMNSNGCLCLGREIDEIISLDCIPSIRLKYPI